MTQDGPRSDTLMIQLDDGTWMARVSLPGQVLEVAGRDRAECLERVLMVIGELDGDER